VHKRPIPYCARFQFKQMIINGLHLFNQGGNSFCHCVDGRVGFLQRVFNLDYRQRK
jgi:hypothetical protein